MKKSLWVKIVSFVLSLVFIMPMLATGVYGLDFSVVAETENVVFKGNEKAQSGSVYDFSLEMADDIELCELKSEISASISLNKNKGEGTNTSTTLLGTTTDDTAYPSITMEEDTDSPMRGVLRYKRVITDSINGGSSTTYKNQNITSLYSSKPSTVSFGFWVKESDISDVFGDNTMDFWPFYQNGAKMVVSLPLKTLMQNVGVAQTITPSMTNMSSVFTNYSVSAVCTARDSGWAHFVCNMENLTYAEAFSPTAVLFYLTLNNITSALRDNKKIEISNFTYLLNDKIESGYIVYPQTEGAKSFQCAVKKTDDGYAVTKEAVKGDIKITAKGLKIDRVYDYSVDFDTTYVTANGEKTAYSDSDYVFEAEAMEGAELYTVYAEVDKKTPLNLNAGEGTADGTTFFPTTKDDGPSPGIDMVEDNDSPMRDVLTYKRVFTDSISVNPTSTTTYRSHNITTIYAKKPETISFGFWLKERDITAVFGDKPLSFWPIYQNGAKMTVDIPVKTLMQNVGVAQAITPSTTDIGKIFAGYSISAVCTARDNGWAHFVCNMENLKYAEGFEATSTLFYIYLANISTVLRNNERFEMSNFTFLINDKIKNGYMVYPQASAQTGFKSALKETEDGKYLLIKENIAGNVKIVAKAAIVPEEGYEPLMKCHVSGNEFYIRTEFDENNDLLQKFKGLTKEDTDYNDPVDFVSSGLVSKSSDSMSQMSTALATGTDEATPFKFNASYIGANHGQSNAIVVTAKGHGKTYADIGSLWKDSAGTKWNLLKVKDEDTLMFLSENMSANINKYTFKNSLSGTLTHIECAENTKDIIVEATRANQQLYSSTKKIEKTVYVIINGKRYKAADGITTGCDYVEVVEKYQIINPATIGEALRANRPEGGYKEPQNLAVGSPLVNFNMIYRIMPDGTVLSIFDHEILEDINFIYYGGIQYIVRKDAFGGGVYRYIPKLKEFTHKELTLDFTETVNMTDLTYPSGFSKDMTKDLWDGANAPDRQIDYYKDANCNIKASFAGGYLPVLDGEISKRSANISAAGFVYQSKKTYPYFVDSKTFEATGTKNKRIQGVAYKKYIPQVASDISYYTIPYGSDTYIYVDCHEISKREFDLSDIIKSGAEVSLIEKRDNVTYSINDGKLSVEMKEGTYGYLVLCVKKSVSEPIKIEMQEQTGSITASIKNNTHENQEIRVIIATYKDGRLADLKTDIVDILDYQTYKYQMETKKTSDKVKVFVWNGDLSASEPIALELTK